MQRLDSLHASTGRHRDWRAAAPRTARGSTIGRRLALAVAFALVAAPASAQFYKEKTLTLLVNYAAGGNADTEARVYQRHLSKYIPGRPVVIIRNVAGAGGATAMNQLGLGIGSQADGMTVGYFTMSATSSIIDDPVLKIKTTDFMPIVAARGWNLVYVRKDIVPGGYTKPSDFARATNIFAGGYSRATSHDTRLRLALEIMGLPYTMVTGFPGTGQINKAMLQNEVNFTGSSLPGYQTQVVPQIIKEGIGVVLFHHPVIGPDGSAQGNPALEKQGMPTFYQFYVDAFGKQPSGPKYDALFLMNDISTKMQRGVFLPKGSPQEAADALRQAFLAVAKDPDFIADYKKITGDDPDLIDAAEVERIFERMRKVDPEVKRVLKESVGAEGG
jgi:tripartite-type tricarboxylate transporter receptor subunit TctC